MLLIIILTAIAVLAAWLWMRESAPIITQFTHLPTPPRLSLRELFSLMRQASKEKKGFFETVQQKHGDLVWIRVPLFRNLALLTSPQYAKSFFAAKEADFLKGFRVIINLVLPPQFSVDFNFTPTYTKAFSAERYAYFAKLLKKQVDLYFEQHWGAKTQTVNLFTEVDHLTLVGMTRSFLGDDLQGKEMERFLQLVKELDIEDRLTHLKRAVYCISPWGKEKSVDLFNEVLEMISKAVDARIANNSTEPDFFNFLIQELRTPSGEPDYHLIALGLFNIIFAGTTNTFATSAWSIAFIASNPDLKAKVVEEKEQYFAALKGGEDVSSLLISGLPFTTRMVQETTRLCMKGLSPRFAVEEMNIADKFVVPKGFYLMFPYELVSHNGGIYSSPLSHNPDRFLTEGKEPFQNIGFGAGRHPCIGAKFALMNIKTLVFNFLDRFDAELKDDVYDLIPKTQVMGVFRPVKPCIDQIDAADLEIKRPARTSSLRSTSNSALVNWSQYLDKTRFNKAL